MPDSFDALPNPRGGSVRSAELALGDALLAFEQHGEIALPLLRASHALRDAGWLGAQRFADTLMLASPLVTGEAGLEVSIHPASGAAGSGEPIDIRAVFAAALRDFHAALGRHNLRELSCSPTLFAHYRALGGLLAQHTPGFTSAFEDLALASRPMPPVSLHAQSADRLAHLRARYERALLPVLRGGATRGAERTRDAQDVRATDDSAEAEAGNSATRSATRTATDNSPPPGATSSADIQAALDELDACLTELAGPDPYDFWRLAKACALALRVSGRASGEADARRFYARCNLALADHARGILRVPRSLVRSTLALLWRDYALFGAAAEDADQVEVLHDYGLTVDWHVAATQASEILWEAGAAEAQSVVAQRSALTRELGVLSVNAHAYEDFLQTADASITALTAHARAADQPKHADLIADARDLSDAESDPVGDPESDPGSHPSEALQAGDAAYRLGSAACALGLGHIALLADALGLAWRRRAHAGVSTSAASASMRTDMSASISAQPVPHATVEAPAAAALEQAAEALRAMLHKVAAGVAPPGSSAALAALTRAIEQGRA